VIKVRQSSKNESIVIQERRPTFDALGKDVCICTVPSVHWPRQVKL